MIDDDNNVDNNDDDNNDDDNDDDKTIPKTKTEYNGVDDEVQVFYNGKIFKNKENGDWRKRQILWVFWNNNHISELCEKCIYKDGNYAYTRFEELHTRSGEVLFANEHKATLSKEKSNTYIDIDELKIFKDFCFKDPTPVKTKDMDKTIPKTKDKVMLDRINNKISIINEMGTMLTKIKVKVKKKIKLIYESMYELQDDIYNDDSWLRLVELNKIDAIIDDALNVTWNMIRKKNRTSSNMINIDKYKDIDGYVSKLTDLINNKIDLLNSVYELIDHIIGGLKNGTNMIDEKIYKVSEMDNDTLHLINNKLKEIMSQLKQNIKKILV